MNLPHRCEPADAELPSWQVEGTRGILARQEQFISSRYSVYSLYFTCPLQSLVFFPIFPLSPTSLVNFNQIPHKRDLICISCLTSALTCLIGAFFYVCDMPCHMGWNIDRDGRVNAAAILRWKAKSLSISQHLSLLYCDEEKVCTEADKEIESLNYLEACRHLNVSILQSSGSPLKSCRPSLLSFSRSLVWGSHRGLL